MEDHCSFSLLVQIIKNEVLKLDPSNHPLLCLARSTGAGSKNSRMRIVLQNFIFTSFLPVTKIEDAQYRILPLCPIVGIYADSSQKSRCNNMHLCSCKSFAKIVPIPKNYILTNSQILVEIEVKHFPRKPLDYLLRSCPLRLRDFTTALITQEWSKISMNLQL